MNPLRRTRTLLAPVAIAAVGLFGATACDSDDDGEPDPTVVESGPGVPFDGSVSPGVDTGTDEGGNMGFEPGEDGGPVGNPTSPDG